jgi:hypothetical protein
MWAFQSFVCKSAGMLSDASSSFTGVGGPMLLYDIAAEIIEQILSMPALPSNCSLKKMM